MSVSRTFWRSMEKIVEGVFAINKPSGLSSAQVLRDCQSEFHKSKLFAPYLAESKAKLMRENHNQRKRRREKDPRVKIGHGGTLDPLATGVLIAGVGVGTKSLQEFLLCTKTYDAVVLFGTGTDTYDRVGKVLRRGPTEHITKEVVEQALGRFRGKFMQLPPLFSALKMNGKPLYEYAREGKPIPREIERRPVNVEHLELLEFMEAGTHGHQPPTEEGSYAEINVANQLWSQERSIPRQSEDSPDWKEKAKQHFETKKRRMSEDLDELVKDEEGKGKRRRISRAGSHAVMSGGLPSPTLESAESKGEETTLISEPLPTTEPALSPPPAATKGYPACRIRMSVTSGFYVRSLCHDLGAALGSAALMSELQRTRQADYVVGTDNVLEYSDLKKGEEVWGPKVEGMIDAWWIAKGKKDGFEPRSVIVTKGKFKGAFVEGGDVDAEVAQAKKEGKTEEVKTEDVKTQPVQTNTEAPTESDSVIEKLDVKADIPADSDLVEGLLESLDPSKQEKSAESGKEANV
ncbi:putative tRNA pseudouridine synthase 4 [Amylocarpus encephaloides]|uniref:tRNA pseudouridine(55) synthase n=1 Tax=Amylocarpus encephaloides TaxID=45428 RepID=A0A9P7Y8U7_9HELO|nr:putative tRNA pseudouridine synthase 4 [Amylocarpus encephaloides]